MSFTRFPHRSLLLGACLVLAAASRAGAQLAASSPFMPAAAATTGAVTEGAPIELRGVMDTGAGMSFCIFDPVRKTSVWSRLNEKDHDFLVKSYDAGNEMVTVEHGGRTLTLGLRAVKVASSGQAMAPAPLPSPGMPAAPGAVTQSVVLNPTPADEQRRLEAVATEVRRRRALREQASIQAAQGVAPAAETPAPQGQPQAQRQNRDDNRNRPRN